MGDDDVKWFFICVAICGCAAASVKIAGELSGVSSLKREAVSLGYATDGADGFQWKEKK